MSKNIPYHQIRFADIPVPDADKMYQTDIPPPERNKSLTPYCSKLRLDVWKMVMDAYPYFRVDELTAQDYMTAAKDMVDYIINDCKVSNTR